MTVVTGESIPAVEAKYDGSGYGQFKADVAEAIVEVLEPIRTRYEELRERPGRARAPLRDRRGESPRRRRARRSR